MQEKDHSTPPKHRQRMQIGDVKVAGLMVDNKSRCTHYHSEKDIISIKFKCCNNWYPCYQCHYALSSHNITRWNKSEHNEKAILCGNCGSKLTIHEYLRCDAQCPHCEAAFNAGCEKHYDRYFGV